ncbi:unnamed protein product [Dimorphilus gyrociliatus]|uniref:RING-type domain-containing protein n=1 Tax=Dimorphilus gyrociliatus TaxID=2664684 RepID=A0A7I8VEE5_9ANNE|nr:unnamed protein product [Dimorphilus gyrociliatus]
MTTTQYTIDSSDLQCAICLEPWVNKDPRMLPCQHTFCLSCLIIQEKDNKIVCAICRTPLLLPEGGAPHLAKNIFFNRIKEIRNELDICKKHDKELLNPTFFCRTCCTRVYCFDCLQLDHSLSECRVFSHEAVKKLNIKCFETINQQRENNTRSLEMILEKFTEHKKSAHELLDKKYRETEMKIKEYFGNREHELCSFIDRTDDIFVKEKLFNNYLKKISTENIVIDETQELAIDHYIRVIDKANNTSIGPFKRHLLRLRDDENISGSRVSLSCNGTYYFSDTGLFQKVLNFQTFTSEENYSIQMNLEASDVYVTRSYIFALNANSKLLYCAQKNNNFITLEEYANDSCKILSIKQNVHDVNVLVMKCSNELCQYENSDFLWSKQNYNDLVDATHFENGNALVVLKSHMLIEHEFRTGNQIRAFPSRGLCQITSISNQGILLLFENKEDGRDDKKILYYADENFSQHKLLDGDIERIHSTRESNHVYVKFASTDALCIFKLI